MTPDFGRWYWNPETVIAVQEFFGPEWEIPFRVVTLLADSSVVLILVAVLFWTRGRRFAYTVLAAAMLGAMVASLLKIGIDVPRPDHPDLIPYETRVSPSFPSGHAMHAVAFWGTLAYMRLIPWSIAAAILVVVSLSRIYLGIHYPIDLFAGAVIGLLGIFIGQFVARTIYARLSDRHLSALIASFFLGSVVIIPFAGEFPLGWEILGGLVGAGAGTLIESRRIGYSPLSVQMNGQLIRIAVGLAGVLVYVAAGAMVRELTDSAVVRTLIFLPLGLWVMLVAPYILDRMGYNARTAQPAAVE